MNRHSMSRESKLEGDDIVYDSIEQETRHVNEQAFKDASVNKNTEGHRISHAEKGARDEENIADHEIAETVNTELR